MESRQSPMEDLAIDIDKENVNPNVSTSTKNKKRKKDIHSIENPNTSKAAKKTVTPIIPNIPVFPFWMNPLFQIEDQILLKTYVSRRFQAAGLDSSNCKDPQTREGRTEEQTLVCKIIGL